MARALFVIALGVCAWLIVEWEAASITPCPEVSSNTEAGQDTKENCGSFRGPLFVGLRSSWYWVGDFVEGHHDAVTAAATLAIALFTLTLWLTTRGLLRAAAINIRHTEKSIELLVADQRPWVPANISLTTGLTMDANGVDVTLHFTLRNTGKSPALNVSIWPEIYPLIGPTINPIGRQREIADRAHMGAVRVEGWGMTLFPGEIAYMNITITLTNREIQRYDAWLKAEHNVADFPFLPSMLILGSIDYKSVVTTEYFQTGFIYDLYALQDGRQCAIPKFATEFPLEKLILQPYPLGSGYVA